MRVSVHHPPSPFSPPAALAPRVASSLHTRSMCTRHLNTRASPAQSSPLLCVNCIIFTPNTVLSPERRARHGLRGQQVKLHMSIVSHPRARSASHVSPPPLPPQRPPRGTLLTDHVVPFFPKVTYMSALGPARPASLLAARLGEIHDPIRERWKVGDFVTSAISRARKKGESEVWRT